MRNLYGWFKMKREFSIADKLSNIFYGKGKAELIFYKIVAYAHQFDEPSFIKHNNKTVELKKGDSLVDDKLLSELTGMTRNEVEKARNFLTQKEIISVTYRAGHLGTVYSLIGEYIEALEFFDGDPLRDPTRSQVQNLSRDIRNTKERNTLNTDIEYNISCPNSQASSDVRYPEPILIPEISKENPKKPKKEKPQKPKVIPSDVCITVATRWLKIALKEYEWRTGQKGWTVEDFAEGFMEIQRKRNLSDDQLLRICELYEENPWWHKNAASPKGLLKKNAQGLTKLDYLMNLDRTDKERKREVEKSKIQDMLRKATPYDKNEILF